MSRIPHNDKLYAIHLECNHIVEERSNQHKHRVEGLFDEIPQKLLT